ncbi:hypothetical protein N7493_011128 [Penicillium malachiteum]|uniref:Aminotransferase class I/classII large domain-containing protein n=1 Tax=Penicillium malachiteum TaxID=1324776 RepID=A0AAD6HBK1_9EURO|nr:hypothetical protein N7493_011128 [Penicillium malachiteum]
MILNPSLPSKRGLANITRDLMMDLSREAEAMPPYNRQTTPDGLVDLTSSLNDLMQNEMQSYILSLNMQPEDYLSFVPPPGSSSLAKAVADFINLNFNPSQNIRPEHIMGANGVSSLLDILSFSVCDPGEAIMLATPNYGMFKHDMQSRNDIRFVDVECDLEDKYFDRFTASNADALVEKYEVAYMKACEDGIRIRAILLCNPCNPLGRCYSRHTLERLAQFCGRRGLHLISDEIYALSAIHPNANGSTRESTMESFTSALSISIEGIDTNMVHVLYGCSKDFGLSALRLGFLITQNVILKESCRRISVPTWVTTFSDRIFTAFLNDRDFHSSYIRQYQIKLSEAHTLTTTFLQEHAIPFSPSNAGLFLWIDLSSSLRYFQGPGNEANGEDASPEMQLTRYLLKQGVYLNPSEREDFALSILKLPIHEIRDLSDL